jgi:hypothetical protein
MVAPVTLTPRTAHKENERNGRNGRERERKTLKVCHVMNLRYSSLNKLLFDVMQETFFLTKECLVYDLATLFGLQLVFFIPLCIRRRRHAWL